MQFTARNGYGRRLRQRVFMYAACGFCDRESQWNDWWIGVVLVRNVASLTLNRVAHIRCWSRIYSSYEVERNVRSDQQTDSLTDSFRLWTANTNEHNIHLKPHKTKEKFLIFRISFSFFICNTNSALWQNHLAHLCFWIFSITNSYNPFNIRICSVALFSFNKSLFFFSAFYLVRKWSVFLCINAIANGVNCVHGSIVIKFYGNSWIHGVYCKTQLNDYVWIGIWIWCEIVCPVRTIVKSTLIDSIQLNVMYFDGWRNDL